MATTQIHLEAHDSDEDRLLVDPSLVVASRTYSLIREELLSANLGEVFFPNAFLDGLKRGDEQLFGYYLSNAEPVSMRTLRNDLAESRIVQGYQAFVTQEERNYSIRSNLLQEFGESRILDSLWEEWTFLQQESWIASRSRKVFRRFIKSGAIALETGRDAFDGLAAKTLKLPKKKMPMALTSRQRLRATAKWVAVGGSSVTALFEPVIGLLGSLAANYFLLMDP